MQTLTHTLAILLLLPIALSGQYSFSGSSINGTEKDLAAVTRQFQQGQDLLQQQQYGEARRIFDRLLARYPDHLLALTGAAQSRAGQLRFADALPLINRASVLSPQDPIVLHSKYAIMLGLIDEELQVGAFTLAHLHLSELEKLFPDDQAAANLRMQLLHSSTASEQTLAAKNQNPVLPPAKPGVGQHPTANNFNTGKEILKIPEPVGLHQF